MKLKKILTSLMLGASIAMTSMTAAADPVNVGGVVFDPDDVFDFLASSGALFENTVSVPGNVASGYGAVSFINGAANFCPTCQLTYTFGGFTLVDPTPTQLLFTGGWMNFYVQDTAAVGYTPYNALNGFATAGDGNVWLSLQAHTDLRVLPALQVGTLFGSITAGVLGTGTERGSGGGMFDVIGGQAAAHFNTNTVQDSLGGFADFNFSSSFQPTNPNAVLAGALPLTGTAELQGNAVNIVPEPESLLLVGLGLFGLALGAKRKKQA